VEGTLTQQHLDPADVLFVPDLARNAESSLDGCDDGHKTKGV